MDIRNLVREKRIYLGLSQKELAYGICCQSTICNFESGKKDLTCDILFKICSRLGIEVLSDSKSHMHTDFKELDNYFYFEEHSKILDELYKLESSKINGSDSFFHKKKCYKESADVGEFGKRIIHRTSVRKHVEKILFLLLEANKNLNRSLDNEKLIEISLGFARINKNKKIIDSLHNQYC